MAGQQTKTSNILVYKTIKINRYTPDGNKKTLLFLQKQGGYFLKLKS